jgi:hypothetical protein
MDSIEELLERLTLTQYLESFVVAGFDTVAALDCITEADFEKLGVKLGHRRILQRHQFRRNGGSDKEAIRRLVDSTVSIMAFQQKKTNCISSLHSGSIREYRTLSGSTDDGQELTRMPLQDLTLRILPLRVRYDLRMRVRT